MLENNYTNSCFSKFCNYLTYVLLYWIKEIYRYKYFSFASTKFPTRFSIP